MFSNRSPSIITPRGVVHAPGEAFPGKLANAGGAGAVAVGVEKVEVQALGDGRAAALRVAGDESLSA